MTSQQKNMTGKKNEAGRDSNASLFRNDSAISGGQNHRERTLQRWVPDASEKEPSRPKSSTGWDVFAENEIRFGLKADFDEIIYTTAIDKSHPQYKQRLAEADKIAREIERSAATHSHITEERSGGNSKTEENNENIQSGVRRQQEFPQLTSSNNRYTPPARRTLVGQSTVRGAPVDPAILSQPAHADKPIAEIAEVTPASNPAKTDISTPPTTTESGFTAILESKLVANTSSSTSHTATVERDVASAFKTFASPRQKNNLERSHVTRRRNDKEIKLNDLKRFADAFKLSIPVPSDLISIIANDPQKQKEIQEKAKRNVEAAQANPSEGMIPIAAPADARPAQRSAPSTHGTSLSHISNRQGPGHSPGFTKQAQFQNPAPIPRPLSAQATRTLGNLDSRLRNAQQAKHAQEPFPVHATTRLSPTSAGPVNNVDSHFSSRSSDVASAERPRLNLHSSKFRLSPHAATFSPNGSLSSDSNTRSAVTTADPVAISRSLLRKQPLPQSERPSIKDKFNALEHIKSIKPAPGKNWKATGGMKPAYDTFPLWRQVDDENPESTMHMNYVKLFEMPPLPPQPMQDPSHTGAHPAHATPGASPSNIPNTKGASKDSEATVDSEKPVSLQNAPEMAIPRSLSRTSLEGPEDNHHAVVSSQLHYPMSVPDIVRPNLYLEEYPFQLVAERGRLGSEVPSETPNLIEQPFPTTSSSRNSHETQITEYSFSEIASDSSDIDSASESNIVTEELPPGIDSDEIFSNPRKYFQELDDFRNTIYQRSAIQFYSSLARITAQSRRPSGQWPWSIPVDEYFQSVVRKDNQEIRAYCDQSTRNAEQENVARDLFHLLECRNLIFTVCNNISSLRSEGFNQTHFSTLVVSPTRPNVANLVTIPFERVENLAKLVDEVLDFIWENIGSPIPRPKDSDVCANQALCPQNLLDRKCADILNSLGLFVELDDCTNWPPRDLWKCTVQVLDLAILSYSLVHTESFGGLSDGTQPDEIIIPLQGLSKDFPDNIPHDSGLVSMRRRSLKCLDKFLRGGQVWVLHRSSFSAYPDEPLYLSTTISAFADIWGPLWKSYPKDDPSKISCYFVGNGLILPWHQNYEDAPQPRTGEVLSHWMPRGSSSSFCDESEIEAFGGFPPVQKSFNGQETLLIGAGETTRKAPGLRFNPNCCTTPDQVDAILMNSGCRRPLGTSKSHTYVDNSQVNVQWGSGGFGPSVGGSRTIKTDGGRTLKETFLEMWELSPERRNIRVFGKAQFGVIVSACTKNAKRTNLFSVLSTSTIRAFLESLQWSESDCKDAFFQALTYEDLAISLPTLWEEHGEWRQEVGRKIFLCLKELKNTGVNKDGQFDALWIPERDREYIATLIERVHGWIPMLKESLSCCTMAVIATRCLEFSDSECGRRCQGPYLDNIEAKGFSVFETRLIINPQAKIPGGFELRSSKHTEDRQRWSVSKVEVGTEIFLGSQGRLRVISSLKRIGILVEWDNNILKDLKYEIKEDFRKLVLRSPPGPCHREYIENEKFEVKPIPLFVIST